MGFGAVVVEAACIVGAVAAGAEVLAAVITAEGAADRFFRIYRFTTVPAHIW
jgi:hypothetical protein